MAVKGSTLFIGQYVFNGTVGAPLVTGTGNALASGLYNFEASSSSAVTVTTTAGVVGGATVTPVAGTYLVIGSCNITASSAGGNTLTLRIYVGGAAQADTARTATPTSTAVLAPFQNMSVSTNKIVTVNGSQAIALEAVTSAGTITLTGIDFDVVRIA